VAIRSEESLLGATRLGNWKESHDLMANATAAAIVSVSGDESML